jgi:hypothetical protein
VNSVDKYVAVPRDHHANENSPCTASAIVDGYHLATMRASRKGSVVVSVKLFELIPGRCRVGIEFSGETRSSNGTFLPIGIPRK